MFTVMVIGVTGGIGSGKTAVCKLLEQHGARVFYADHEAKQIMQTDVKLREELEEAFGPETWLDDGSLNKKFLASVIFTSDEHRLQMNAIVHPAVKTAFESFRRDQEELCVQLIVKEAALLFESSTQNLDAVVVVDAPVNVRIERVMNRDGITSLQVQERMHGQMSDDEMRSRADIIIDNSGPCNSLKTEVDRLMTILGGFERPTDT